MICPICEGNVLEIDKELICTKCKYVFEDVEQVINPKTHWEEEQHKYDGTGNSSYGKPEDFC